MSDVTKEIRNRIFEYIVKYKMENDGLSPSLRQIANACGLKTTTHTAYHVRSLALMGYLELPVSDKDNKRVRAIKVKGGRWTLESDPRL